MFLVEGDGMIEFEGIEVRYQLNVLLTGNISISISIVCFLISSKLGVKS